MLKMSWESWRNRRRPCPTQGWCWWGWRCERRWGQMRERKGRKGGKAEADLFPTCFTLSPTSWQVTQSQTTSNSSGANSSNRFWYFRLLSVYLLWELSVCLLWESSVCPLWESSLSLHVWESQWVTWQRCCCHSGHQTIESSASAVTLKRRASV